jgi:hypothetical protein
MTSVHRAGAVSTVALSAVALTLGLAQAVAPRWVKHVGLDVWNLPNLRTASKAADDEAIELQAKEEQLRQSIEVSEHIAARLVEGAVTLAQAIDELEPLLRERPGFDYGYQTNYHVNTFRQGVARYTINRAQRMLAANPSRWATISPHLEAEFNAIQ